MAIDYEKVYRGSRHALGEPSREFLHFFENFKRSEASVLDVGCGQGRDEARNIPAFEGVLDQSDSTWTPVLKRRGYLFVQRDERSGH